MAPVATISTPGAIAAAHGLPLPHLRAAPPRVPAEPAATLTAGDDMDHDQQIPLNSDNVHQTWSEFTKKKNVRAELTRLENISWRIWHALRLRAESGRPQPRFAVRVDAATACFVDPAFALPAADNGGSGAAQTGAADTDVFPPPPRPASPSRGTAHMPPPPTPAPPHHGLRGRKQSLQVDPRALFPAHRRKASAAPSAASAARSAATAAAAAAVPAQPSVPPAASGSGALVHASAAPNKPSPSSTARPYIVIHLPASFLDPHAPPSRGRAANPGGAPAGPTPGMGRPAAGTRGSGAASPSGLIKRSDRHVDLSRYFGVPSLRMLTGTALATGHLVGPASPISAPAPVVFVMGGDDDDGDDVSDNEDEDGMCFLATCNDDSSDVECAATAYRPRASLDESRSGVQY